MKSNSRKTLSQLAFAILALSFMTLSLNSCSRNCGGGGWYGDRNLSDTKIEKPVEIQPVATESELISEEVKSAK